MSLLLYILIIICAGIGFAICWHISESKKSGTKIICPTDSDCELVIHSRYATWQGIAWEKIGLWYYGLICLAYLTVIFIPFVGTTAVLLVLFAITVCASSVAGYLVYVQGLLIKEWCTICLLSSLLCFSILLATLALWF